MDAQRKRLAIAFLKARYKNGLTAQEIVDVFNKRFADDARFDTPYTKGFVTSHWRDLRAHDPTIEQRIKAQYSNTPQATPVMPNTVRSTIPKADKLQRRENKATDVQSWVQARDMLLSNHTHLRVMHMNDLHLPYHDENAVSLFLQLAKRFNPHIVVVGSDAFDYPTISRYETDPDISIDDWLAQTRQYWKPTMQALRESAPNAILPFILGNHDRRALLNIKQQSAPQVLMDEWLRTIRDRNVLWLGKTEVLEIGRLVIAHGKRFNKYASAYTAGDFNYRPVNVGHTHRPQQMLGCTINGMLCQAVPAYNDNGYPSDWQHGTSLITYNTRTGQAMQTPYIFSPTANGLECAYGQEILKSEQA